MRLTITFWYCKNIHTLYVHTIFPDPKAQKSQGKGLANKVFLEYGSFATDVVVRMCPQANMSLTFLTCRKVILRDILN